MTGDPGLLRALLDSVEMPQRWRRQLLMRFRRPEDFRATLHAMASPDDGGRTSASDLVDRLAEAAKVGPEEAVALVEHELERRGLPLVGGRKVEDIARRLLEKAQDRRTPPLSRETVALVEDFLAISGPMRTCAAELERIAERAGDPMERAVAAFTERLALLPEDGGTKFATGFGRSFDYYTGFVFQIEADAGGRPVTVGGGGRYDDMLAGLGGPDVPACGFGLHTERLLMAAGGA